MPVPTGAVTFISIQAEFGGANPISMSEYYRGGAFVPSNQVTSSVDGNPISTSGTIRVGTFRALTKTVVSSLSLTGPTTVSGANGTFNYGDTVSVTTETAIMSASGGVFPYTYQWTYVSGETAVVSNPTGSSTQFSRGQVVESFLQGVYRCTVTDAASNTVSVNVNVWTSAINLN